MARHATGLPPASGSVAAGATGTAIVEVVWAHGTTVPARTWAALGPAGRRSLSGLAGELREARRELGSDMGGRDARAPERPPGLEAVFQ